jgi:hypothetical protein
LKLLNLHNELKATISIFNESYGVLVFGSFVYCFGALSLEIYFMYGSLISKSLDFSLVHALYNFINIVWMFPHVFSLECLGDACAGVKSEVEKTEAIFRKNRGKMCERQVGKVLVSLKVDDFQFTANGFFVLDSSIVYSVSL